MPNDTLLQIVKHKMVPCLLGEYSRTTSGSGSDEAEYMASDSIRAAENLGVDLSLYEYIMTITSQTTLQKI